MEGLAPDSDDEDGDDEVDDLRESGFSRDSNMSIQDPKRVSNKKIDSNRNGVILNNNLGGAKPKWNKLSVFSKYESLNIFIYSLLFQSFRTNSFI